jgi:hypothetical protein
MLIRKSHILILVAYGLALLHSTIPHQHASIRTNQPKFEIRTLGDSSFLGLLQAAFATDLGCGHLESFAKSDTGTDVTQAVSDVPVVFLASLYFIEEPLSHVREVYGSFIEKLHARILLLSSRQFRAPPFFS